MTYNVNLKRLCYFWKEKLVVIAKPSILHQQLVDDVYTHLLLFLMAAVHK